MATLREALSLGLLIAAAIGAAIVVLQIWVLRRHLRGSIPRPRTRPPISILKPLCGLDDQLAQNLASFAALPYPDYEVVLGVASVSDPAFPIADQTVRRWPQRFRLVIQRGAPGLNPKVNQLIGLAAVARADLLVISDSNARVPAGYLDEIAAQLEDPTVGLVTHPLVGIGDSPASPVSWGARLDHLHLTATITPGFVTASALCGKTYVVGKSMAMRRSDLERVGGFRAVKDVLAEDFVLGRRIPAELGKRVVLGRNLVSCVTVQRSLAAFAARYARWCVMQRQCAGLAAYLGLFLHNPVVLAALAVAVAPSALGALSLALICAARALANGAAGRLTRGQAFGLRTLLLVPLEELLAGAAWLHGLCRNTIVWRSTRLRVGRGSALTAERPSRRRPSSGPTRPNWPRLPPFGATPARPSAR